MSATVSPGETFPYTVLVQRRGGKFQLTLPEFDLECEAADLDQGYRELEAVAQKLLARFRERGLTDDILSPQPAPSGAGLRTLLRIVAIVVLLASLPGVLAATSVLKETARVARDVRQLTGSVATLGSQPGKAARQFSTTLERLAHTIGQVTPERQEQMRRDMRVIVEKLKPLADELRPLFTDEAAPAMSSAPASHDSGAYPAKQ